jgi:hypothetical protein
VTLEHKGSTKLLRVRVATELTLRTTGWSVMSDQAIIFLTHSRSRRVLRHFHRLSAETRGLLSTFLCVHDPRQPDDRARILVAAVDEERKYEFLPQPSLPVEAGERILPYRTAQMRICSTHLRGYDHIWVLEYDVDFAGNWRDFFLTTMESKAAQHPRHPEDSWPHWSWFRSPAEIPDDKHLRSFNPICRFSQRMIAVYVQAVQSDVWLGHTEALYPTIAWFNRLTISDLGGGGPYCPEELHGKNYYYDDAYPSGTFNHVPAVRSAYFHEKPEQFIQHNLLYHPVKVNVRLRARLKRYYERALEVGGLATHFGPKKC